MRAELVILIVATAATAISTRFITVTVFSFAGMPSWLERWLRHVPVAVFSALVAPAVFLPQGQNGLSLGNPYLGAGFVTVALAWRFGNFAVTVGLGTMVMVIWRWFQQ